MIGGIGLVGTGSGECSCCGAGGYCHRCVDARGGLFAHDGSYYTVRPQKESLFVTDLSVVSVPVE